MTLRGFFRGLSFSQTSRQLAVYSSALTSDEEQEGTQPRHQNFRNSPCQFNSNSFLEQTGAVRSQSRVPSFSQPIYLRRKPTPQDVLHLELERKNLIENYAGVDDLSRQQSVTTIYHTSKH